MCWFIFSISLYAQSLIDSTNIDYIIEDQMQSLSGQQVLEDLNDRIEQPVDLNTATKEELLSIPGMNPLTADMILKRKTEAGTLRTMSQIDDIQDLDPRLLSYLHTFTGLGLPEHQPSVLLRSRCMYDFQKSRGYTTGMYKGSRPAVMNRLTWKVNDDIETSFLTEKDAGESSFTDFMSGYILLKKIGFITSAVAGDFTVESGNGAAFGYSSSFGKGSDVILPLSRTTRGVVPYRSTGETHFFRGGGVNFKASSVDGYFFLSRKTIDATLNDSGAISSLYDLGYHRPMPKKPSMLPLGKALSEPALAGLFCRMPTSAACGTVHVLIHRCRRTILSNLQEVIIHRSRSIMMQNFLSRQTGNRFIYRESG